MQIGTYAFAYLRCRCVNCKISAFVRLIVCARVHVDPTRTRAGAAPAAGDMDSRSR